MKVRVFAALTDHFEQEFYTEKGIEDVQELCSYMITKSPHAAGLLKKSRFAVNNTFVPNSHSLLTVEEVLVMPPVSGG